MRVLYKNKMATSLALISILSFQPTVSFAKEDPISNFFTKMFSSKSSKTDQSKKNQIFKSDISFLNIQNLEDFKTSIKSILKNYLDEKKINNFLKNISNEKDKNLDANSLDQFDNLLPKSNTDKVKGQALIRIAKKLGKDEKTIFEIKKNIILQVVASEGLTLVYKEKPKKTDVAEVEKENDLDIKESSSSNMSIIAGIAGIAAIGGGGGGSSGGGGISDGDYRNTVEGSYGTEYNANDALAFQNILTLNNYGYTGNGIKVAVVDTGIDASHQEFDGKTIYGKDFASSISDQTEDEDGHGTHVASIISGDRDETGMRGMAYDATLYSYKVDDGRGTAGLEGLVGDNMIANVFNQHVTDNIIVSNNSWGGNIAINATNEAAIRAAYPTTITAMRAAQNNGTIIVFASGNDSRSQPDSFGASPYHISELVNEWLVVTSVDSDGIEPSYTNRCGVASSICVTAVGGDLTSAAGGVYGAATGTNDSTTNNYVSYQGTSMAAPHVSGLAAALAEKFPSLTAAQIVTRIKNGASFTGLTGRGGETTANSTNAQLQAIFGHGLINGTTSAAAFGNFIYANGNNLLNGQDLSARKISLPTSLPLSTQNKILESKFIVFDSFDGARFSVNGSEVFKVSNSSIVRTYGNLNKIDIHNDPKFGFTSTGEKINHSKWSPRYITAGNSNEMSTADGFWGNSASLFSSSSILQGQTLTNFIWSNNIGNVVIQPFFQVQDSQGSSDSFSGYGASFHLDVNEGLKAVAGYKMSDQQFNNGIISDNTSSGNVRDFELGFIQDLSTKDNLFIRFSNSQIQDLRPTDKTFGFNNVKSDNWTIGYETHNKFGSFVFGISKPNQISSGTLSLLTPTGRTQSGDVYYTETEFTVSSENKLDRFFAFQHEKDNFALSFGLVEDRHDYGNIGAAKLNISFHF